MPLSDLRPLELQKHLRSAAEAPLLLDVREPWEFAICHLASSILVPMNSVPAAVTNGKLPKEREIVVICHHGIRSRQVAMYLQHMGYERVINLAGGVQAWAQDIDRDMATY